MNAKVQRPGVCNAAETLLVHAEVAEEFLPGCAQAPFRICPQEVTPAALGAFSLPDGAPAGFDSLWLYEYSGGTTTMRLERQGGQIAFTD